MRLSSLLTKCLIIFFASACSFAVIYFFGRQMLFDRFIYQKNITYGYWVGTKEKKLEIFGDRTKDMVDFKNYLFSRQYAFDLDQAGKTENILGATDKGVYTIFVIGDSIVFGQGIQTEQRFSNILEKRLGAIKKTRVIVLGNSGDNIWDNYIKYIVAVDEFGPPDLTLFSIVDNDLFFNEPGRYSQKIFTKIVANCQGKEVYDIALDQLNPPSEKGQSYGQLLYDSYAEDTKNFCALKNVLNYLPKEKTLYLSFDSLGWLSSQSSGWLPCPIQVNLSKNGFAVFAFDDYYKKHKGDYFFDTLFDNDPFFVSKRERHPSVLANKIFADSLFAEITTNSKWGFR